MEDGGIEMRSTGGHAEGDGHQEDEFRDEELLALDSQPTLSARLFTSRRCMVVLVFLLGLSLVIFLLGANYFAAEDPFVEEFDTSAGVLTDQFESPEEQEVSLEPTTNKEGAHNPFGGKHGKHNAGFPKGVAKSQQNQQQIEALEEWEQEHPGEPFPSELVTKGNGRDRTKGVFGGRDRKKRWCDYSQTEDWLNATVTKDDGKMYDVIEMLEHDPGAFTQGLTYARGQLWESTGLYGHSTVRSLDPDTAAVLQSESMDASLFGEGMTFFKGQLIQITWKSQEGLIYDPTTLKQISNFTFESTRNEGWGITWDKCNDELIMTDGSAFLHFWDPKSLAETRKVKVTRMDGSPAKELNEIEWWRGRVLANVWYEDVLLVIDPATGVVEKEYDFSMIWPKSERTGARADVFNGISISKHPGILYVTGKKWNRMFRVKLLF